MHDHELSVVMQQERERAIREARLHHRYQVEPSPSMRQRLAAGLRRAFAAPPPTEDQVGTSRAPTTAGSQATTSATPAGNTRSVPG